LNFHIITQNIILFFCFINTFLSNFLQKHKLIQPFPAVCPCKVLRDSGAQAGVRRNRPGAYKRITGGAETSTSRSFPSASLVSSASVPRARRRRFMYTRIFLNTLQSLPVRTFPLQRTAWRIIKDRQPDNPNEPVFPYLNTKSETTYYLTGWADAAGVITHVSRHTARRTFATPVLENGTDIYTVARLLGHTGIKQVAKYAHVTDELRRKAVEALPCIDL
jgi:hypothetical protein